MSTEHQMVISKVDPPYPNEAASSDAVSNRWRKDKLSPVNSENIVDL